MTLRRYANLAAPQTLASDINDTASTLEVGSTSLFPEPPFLLGVDRGTPSEEVMLCTNKTSTTFTVTRGYDGTTAVAHQEGALVEHTVAAIDYREAGIPRITTAQRDGLAGADLWTGRVIYNTDTSKLQIHIGGAWINVGPRTGAIEAFGGTTAPQGTLLCHGQEVSRTTYADLFAVIGTAFGAGDGATTFKLPDLRGRFPLGQANSGTGSVLGSTGGQIDHRHTGPSHRHTISHTHTINPPSLSVGGGAHTHGHNLSVRGETPGDGAGPSPGIAGSGHFHALSGGISSSSSSHTHTVNIPAFTSGAASTSNSGFAGTDQTGTANPPFQVVNFIIYL